MKGLIYLIFFTVALGCRTQSSPDFIYIHPDGFSNGRSIHFLIYDDPNKVPKGLPVHDDGTSSKEFKSAYLLKYIPEMIKEIDTKKSIEYRYEVSIQSNGERKEFLLDQNWIPVIKEIRKHIVHDKLKTLQMDRLLDLIDTFPNGIKSHKDAP